MGPESFRSEARATANAISAFIAQAPLLNCSHGISGEYGTYPTVTVHPFNGLGAIPGGMLGATHEHSFSTHILKYGCSQPSFLPGVLIPSSMSVSVSASTVSTVEDSVVTS